MKIIKIGEPKFGKLRRENAIYVDKTEHIHRMWVPGGYFFLSRPRRFGKSLTVSTLNELALGRRELFEGLWIYDKLDNWDTHPVIHLSFDAISNNPGKLEPNLIRALEVIAQKYGVEITENELKEKFKELIEKLSVINPVVLLIDEYDKPLTDHFSNLTQAYANRDVLRDFYSPLKTLTDKIRLIFITGVSKFSRMSLFSVLNNLTDITIDARYATMCGYTETELTEHFDSYWHQLAAKLQISYETLRAEIRRRYDGYNWLGELVYNPWSILNCCDKLQMGNFWYSSGSPIYLIQKLHDGSHFNLQELVVSQTLIDSYELEDMDYRNLLFQTGYLTIAEYHWQQGEYVLRYPNAEVEESLHQHLLGSFSEQSAKDALPTIRELLDMLKRCDMDAFKIRFNGLFASIPDNMFFAKYEGYFQAIIHLTFRYLGLYARSEVRQAKGRLDTIVILPMQVYIFEFKVNDTAAAALQQIKDRDYAAPYRGSGKEIILVGIALSQTQKGIADLVHEIVK